MDLSFSIILGLMESCQNTALGRRIKLNVFDIIYLVHDFSAIIVIACSPCAHRHHWKIESMFDFKNRLMVFGRGV